MFSTLQFVAGLALIFGIFALATNVKLRRRLWGLWNRKTDQLADNIGDVITDTKQAIANANTEVENFERQIAKAMGEITVAKSDHASAVADAQKWGRIAEHHAKQGDEANTRTAVQKKQAAEKRALSIKTQTDLNIAQVEKLKAQLAARKDQLTTAESDIVVQEARQTSLKMRDDMLQASSAFGGSFADLEQARKEIDRYQAELDARDELRGSSAEELERLYNIDTNVNDEVQRLMSSGSAKTGG